MGLNKRRDTGFHTSESSQERDIPSLGTNGGIHIDEQKIANAT